MSAAGHKDLQDRVALVIGAGSLAAGLGTDRAIAICMARAGARVIVGDADLGAAEEIVTLIRDKGGQAEARAADVLEDASIIGLIAGIEPRHGRLDILHCNVGLGKSGPSENISPADWRRISDTNLTLLHVAAQAALPMMRAGNFRLTRLALLTAGLFYAIATAVSLEG